MDVKTAIENGDAATLRRLLSEHPPRANELILWGKCVTHPLHYISDMLFAGTLKNGWSIPPAGNCGGQRAVVARLIGAGATVDPEWLEDEKVRADQSMLAALRG
jgi:hypothetical protein